MNKVKLTSVIGGGALVLGIVWWLFFWFLIPARYTGVVVPLVGSEQGDAYEIDSGWHHLVPSEKLYRLPHHVIRSRFDKEDNGTSPLSFGIKGAPGTVAEIGVNWSFRKEKGKAKKVVLKYQATADEIRDVHMRQSLSSALQVTGPKYAPDSLVAGTGLAQMLTDLEEILVAEWDSLGVEIEKVYWLDGGIDFPAIIDSAMVDKVKAVQLAQQRENEEREAKARANIQIAEARGDSTSRMINAQSIANANNLIDESLTPEILALRHNEKWNGEYPNVISGEAARLLLQVPSNGKK